MVRRIAHTHNEPKLMEEAKSSILMPLQRFAQALGYISLHQACFLRFLAESNSTIRLCKPQKQVALIVGGELQGAESVQPLHDRISQEREEINWACGDCIGQGAFGKVVLGLNVVNGELMAVKQAGHMAVAQ